MIERALEMAGLMLGTDKARRYCLEMICAGFWREAGANIDGSKTLMLALRQIYYRLLPPEQQSQFRHEIKGPLCRA